MKTVSVGPTGVCWAVDKKDTKGKEWTKIDGSMKTVSVGPTGVCWAVDKKDTVWRRLGGKSSNPIGSKWQSVTGRLSHITVGQAGVWGISPKNEVMYRDQTYDLPGDAEGTGWTKVDEEGGCLWGVESPDSATCKKGAGWQDITAGNS